MLKNTCIKNKPDSAKREYSVFPRTPKSTGKTSSSIKPKDILNRWEKSNREAEQLAKWIALYNAVNLIADECENNGISFDDIEIKPLRVREFIDSTVDIIQRKLLNDVYGIDIIYSNKDEYNENLSKFDSENDDSHPYLKDYQ